MKREGTKERVVQLKRRSIASKRERGLMGGDPHNIVTKRPVI